MPDYGFYTDVYQGTSVPESAFAGLIARARDYMQKLERCCRVVPYGPDSRRMAMCAVAEKLHGWYKKRDLSQTTIGGVTVRYEKSDASLQRQLLQTVAGYLEVYRGVG